MSTSPTKPCAVCGRTITWRKKWERDWDQVKYCSDACRRRGKRPQDDELERAILDLLAQRAAGATICPSEVARKRAGDDEAAWRDLMPDIRSAAARLCARGVLEITQQGRVVEPSTARGAIRLRLAPHRPDRSRQR